jgi:UDP-N-acetylmuramoyl-L-alanyl-D-glutamate--2,6-diaminopimelate ligase
LASDTTQPLAAPWIVPLGRLDYFHMQLTDLLKQSAIRYTLLNGDAEISGLVSDSRLVQPGFLFVAITGGTSDGHQYIPAALEGGAAAIAGTRPVHRLKVPYVLLDDSRKALPYLAAAFYGFPARQLTMLGVTGTDGKTTTTNMIYRILLAAGIKAGMISTINAVIADQVLDTGLHVTTPDAPDIQRYLAQMVQAGITHVVLEVTSHGLAQYRADACEFDVGVITNITHEHLDYHGTYEQYRSAKARLFTGLAATLPKPRGNPRVAVLNRDDTSYQYLSKVSTGEPFTYGFHPDADFRPENIRTGAAGMSFVALGKGRQIPIHCPLVGDFNIANCLAAISATVFALGVDPGSASKGIASLQSVPGRMEKIDLGQEFTAMVDFAHTPNALEKALKAARTLTHARLIAIFGAAGLRDRQKRRLMAEVSAELADLTILTAEDPRTELLEDILAEMAAGAAGRGGLEGQTFWRVPDRGEAMRLAISLARAGDLIIACGKGHEQSMCFGETEYPWDDRTAMRAALSEHLGIPGPKMPYLPTQDR